MPTRRTKPGAPGESGEGWSSRLNGTRIRGTAPRRDAGECQACDRRVVEREPDNRGVEDGDRERQVRGGPDRGLKDRVPVIRRVGEGRDRGKRLVPRVRGGLARRVMVRGEVQVREGMPDLPGRLHRARKEKQAKGNETRHSRSWHVTTIAPGNREWQTGPFLPFRR